jgi:hypothetical protein
MISLCLFLLLAHTLFRILLAIEENYDWIAFKRYRAEFKRKLKLRFNEKKKLKLIDRFKYQNFMLQCGLGSCTFSNFNCIIKSLYEFYVFSTTWGRESFHFKYLEPNMPHFFRKVHMNAIDVEIYRTFFSKHVQQKKMR